jgi:hypothetical protein
MDDGENAVMDRACASKRRAVGFCPITSGLAAHISERSNPTNNNEIHLIRSTTIHFLPCCPFYHTPGSIRSATQFTFHVYPRQSTVSSAIRYASPQRCKTQTAALQTPKEINIGKLLHLLHVSGLGYFLIVEENPRGRLFVGHLFADECDVVTVVD